ncbi:MAG: hypothetical protein J0M24_21905 [Verrucomicrobia bacterium]|nr:hypothetical protein [Verrucomicrobiota bacterium]
MSPRQLIDLQLDAMFGRTMPQKMQALVDADINEGGWQDGYELAFISASLDQAGGQKLLNMVLAQHPEFVIDQARLLAAIESVLPQRRVGARVLWIVDETGSYALTDSLRVARFEGSRVIWRSPRISWDGIEFDSLIDGRLRGRAWWLGSHESPDSPFEFDFESGELLVGQIVPE